MMGVEASVCSDLDAGGLTPTSSLSSTASSVSLEPKPEAVATEAHCVACFAALEKALCHTSASTESTAVPFALAKAPVFVTWHSTERCAEGQVRGCLGSLTRAVPLKTLLLKYAVASALSDCRFAAVEASELPSLKCTVSVLHSFQPMDAEWSAWKQTDGVYMTASHCGAEFRATFLPGVCARMKWNKRQTVAALFKKAKVPKTATISPAFERFDSSKCQLTWKQYRDLVAGH